MKGRHWENGQVRLHLFKGTVDPRRWGQAEIIVEEMDKRCPWLEDAAWVGSEEASDRIFNHAVSLAEKGVDADGIEDALIKAAEYPGLYI